MKLLGQFTVRYGKWPKFSSLVYQDGDVPVRKLLVYQRVPSGMLEIPQFDDFQKNLGGQHSEADSFTMFHIFAV